MMQTSGQKFRSQRTNADHVMRALLLIAGVIGSICALTVLGYYVKDLTLLILELLK
jgi:hypothetical protein